MKFLKVKNILVTSMGELDIFPRPVIDIILGYIVLYVTLSQILLVQVRLDIKFLACVVLASNCSPSLPLLLSALVRVEN